MLLVSVTRLVMLSTRLVLPQEDPEEEEEEEGDGDCRDPVELEVASEGHFLGEQTGSSWSDRSWSCPSLFGSCRNERNEV